MMQPPYPRLVIAAGVLIGVGLSGLLISRAGAQPATFSTGTGLEAGASNHWEYQWYNQGSPDQLNTTNLNRLTRARRTPDPAGLPAQSSVQLKQKDLKPEIIESGQR